MARDLNNRPELPKEDVLKTKDAKTPGGGNVNPFSHEGKGSTGGSGGVNPSGPSTGTEGWGLGADEGSTTSEGQEQLGSERGEFNTERDESPVGERSFRCSDVGNADCRFETTAHTEEELMSRIEEHGREAHGINSFDADTRRKMLDAIHHRRAA